VPSDKNILKKEVDEYYSTKLYSLKIQHTCNGKVMIPVIMDATGSLLGSFQKCFRRHPWYTLQDKN
jgi:hypothetical protein